MEKPEVIRTMVAQTLFLSDLFQVLDTSDVESHSCFSSLSVFWVSSSWCQVISKQVLWCHSVLCVLPVTPSSAFCFY